MSDVPIGSSPTSRPAEARPGAIVIAGGGVAGLTLALALRSGLGASAPITVADPQARALAPHRGRATAVVAAARHMLAVLGVWEALEADAQPILDMVVTDSHLRDVGRPVFLTFSGEIAPGEPFAHMVENDRLIGALLAKVEAAGITLRETAVESAEPQSGSIRIGFSDGTTAEAALLAAADGWRSRIRARAGIAFEGGPYKQSGIVTTVEHERPHEGRAEEHFFPAGPFAILPLKGNRSSIVWTESSREAERLTALPADEFHEELERRFGLRLGEIKVAGPVSAHPLGIYVARRFYAERLALVGDAAHLIHPIAGQGLNMGLRDVAALAEVVTDAARLGLDCGSAAVLDRYQAWRGFDTLAMGVTTDVLNRLFSNNSEVLRMTRDFGLGMVDRVPALKRFFIREAAGLGGTVPKLLQGEML